MTAGHQLCFIVRTVQTPAPALSIVDEISLKSIGISILISLVMKISSFVYVLQSVAGKKKKKKRIGEKIISVEIKNEI